MPKQSSGLLVYRQRGTGVEVFLVHPGGPFWAKKDGGAWTIPKGELESSEDPLDAARREFLEETGVSVEPPFLSLGTIRQSGGKLVHAFGAATEINAEKIVSNTFRMEWPPRSGRFTEFPEVDRAAWFPIQTATANINPAQRELLTRLRAALEQTEGSR
jgi:predicted NUDIX family NTP pyrophosphohydrolase